MTGTVHVIGAGLSGLAAALSLADAGVAVRLYESSPQAGGRCRSYHDQTLGMVIDNGNHLLLSANTSALAYARRIGGDAALEIAPDCSFPFADLSTGARWTLRPGMGRTPWWIFDGSRRVPGTRPADYLGPARLFFAGPDATVSDRMATDGALYERLWHPILVAALNTDPREASARLAARLIRETFGKGGAACRPVIASGGLSAALVDPALATLSAAGVPIRFGASLKALERESGRASALVFAGERVPLGPGDRVILAVPPRVAGAMVPDITVPLAHRAILNVHFVDDEEATPDSATLIGLVGGISEWLFRYRGRLSVTVSAADRLMDAPREDIARQIWHEVASIIGRSDDMPRWQIVRERRATIAATPAEEARRPHTSTPLQNLFLAGDWTATGLPATIEGAIRSGERAADFARRAT
ncbi:hydroxysqualene dehydroxylase HpnE [Acuticoccus sp. M5D2P5]|uniref:hydroxysqualene dehydroxylase HpnE n=1 Tax=Acuticoccus kalidii TaxID=2910977 RepID=UPI001F316C29|nr:hydroxysqualene dehydroxylase HpnE [Acuticoccus kalidii]MCF3935829.1 hydroxysqualene dehydroxylase HpnE [Acuticoccus kalidii]